MIFERSGRIRHSRILPKYGKKSEIFRGLAGFPVSLCIFGFKEKQNIPPTLLEEREKKGIIRGDNVEL